MASDETACRLNVPAPSKHLNGVPGVPERRHGLGVSGAEQGLAVDLDDALADPEFRVLR